MQTDQDLTAFADRVRKHFDDQCFACGRVNPVGLRVDGFRLNDGELTAEFTPRPEHRGAPGMLHGGITATAMDEILAWAGMIAARVVLVTGTLEIRYRKPVALDAGPITLAGRLDGRSGRRLHLSGSLTAGGVSAVTAQGIYVAMHDLDEVLGEG